MGGRRQYVVLRFDSHDVMCWTRQATNPDALEDYKAFCVNKECNIGVTTQQNRTENNEHVWVRCSLLGGRWGYRTLPPRSHGISFVCDRDPCPYCSSAHGNHMSCTHDLYRCYLTLPCPTHLRCTVRHRPQFSEPRLTEVSSVYIKPTQLLLVQASGSSEQLWLQSRPRMAVEGSGILHAQLLQA